MSQGPEYDLARQLAVGLEKFEGYKPDEEEIRGIGQLILLWADRDWEKGQIRERFPAVFSAALECLTEIRRNWRNSGRQILTGDSSRLRVFDAYVDERSLEEELEAIRIVELEENPAEDEELF